MENGALPLLGANARWSPAFRRNRAEFRLKAGLQRSWLSGLHPKAEEPKKVFPDLSWTYSASRW